MGAVIAGESWLLDMAHEGERFREVAAQILRAQITIPNRTGHILVLGWQTYRNEIYRAARWGRVAAVIVECDECRCQAPLSEWVRSGKLTERMRQEVIAERQGSVPGMALLYLRKCPGAEIAGYLRDSAHGPKEGGR